MEASFAKLLTASYALLDTAYGLRDPGSLPVSANIDGAADEARKILRGLRNLQNNSFDAENWLRIGELVEQQHKIELLHRFINIYAGQVKLAQLTDPELLKHFTIAYAGDAAGSLAVSVALHTLEVLPDISSHIADLDDRLEEIPPEWDNRQGQSVERLIDAIESGLTHLLRKPIGDRSPVDRLIEVSGVIQDTVRQLYSVEDMEDPAREESVELAREILRRLKDLTFSDKNIEDAIDTGRPTEKLAFAQKIAEMVGTYKNLLFEAMRINPDIIYDPRVKNANDSAAACANGISLMAAKEIPLDASSAQQISVDLNDISGERRAQNVTLGKLMNKMEDGVDRTAEEISENKKKQNKSSVEAEKAAQAERVRRRRRRRQQHQAAIAGHNNVRNEERETISERRENLQGGKEAKALGSLTKADIDAVRKAGSSLRNSNRQASAMMTTTSSTSGGNKKNDKKNKDVIGVADVDMNNKFSPDDKGFAARERDNLNPNNPRNRPRIG